MKIVFTGGGTMGSVTPLLAVAEKMQQVEPTTDFFWIGTKSGPEKQLVEKYNIKFSAISGGKLRRYFSWQNFLDPFRVIAGFFQSIKFLRQTKPDVIITAGAFISVPVVWAGWFLRIPSIVHQQDIIPGLANRLMAWPAKKITVTFEESLKKFYPKKTVWAGNPVRKSVLTGSKERAVKEFGLEKDLPTVLIVGGGTGSLAINKLVVEAMEKLVDFCQVVHVTGGNKLEAKKQNSRYHFYEFLTDKMNDAIAAADIVVSRAGLGFLTELAAWGKPVILLPLPGTHQEANANYFSRRNAAWVLNQKETDSENFSQTIASLLYNDSDKANLSRNIKSIMKWDADQAMVDIIWELTGE